MMQKDVVACEGIAEYTRMSAGQLAHSNEARVSTTTPQHIKRDRMAVQKMHMLLYILQTLTNTQ